MSKPIAAEPAPTSPNDDDDDDDDDAYLKNEGDNAGYIRYIPSAGEIPDGLRSESGLPVGWESDDPPNEACRARDVAAHLLGRRCIYKDKHYLGPVEVDIAQTNGRRILVSMLARPWQESTQDWRLTLNMPVRAVSGNAFSVMLDLGYGINGIFVHDAAAVRAIDALRAAGGTRQQLLDAVNFAEGLPGEFDELRFRRFPGEWEGWR